MAQEAIASIRQQRDVALAALDDTVRRTAGTVSESTAHLLALVAESEEIDATIARLTERRREVFHLKEEHSKQHAATKATALAKVDELFQAGQVPHDRRLSIAVELLYGWDWLAMSAALREGQRYMGTLHRTPFICRGYVYLSGSMWSGGQILAGAQVVFRGNTFNIALPVLIDGRRETCNISIDELSRPRDDGYANETLVSKI